MMNQFGITLPNWMKWLVFLVVCLIVSITIGYFKGRANNRESLNTILSNNVEVRPLDERIVLVYTCNGEDLYRYDVDSKNLQQIPFSLFGEQETFFQTISKEANGFWGGASLIGALTGAYRYASPVISGANQWKYFIVGIIAGGSGLYVGYQIGSLVALPSCDDERIKVKLQEKNNWKTVAEDVAKKLLAQSYLLAGKNATPYTEGRDIEKRIVSGQIDSGLFRALTEIKDKYKKLNPD